MVDVVYYFLKFQFIPLNTSITAMNPLFYHSRFFFLILVSGLWIVLSIRQVNPTVRSASLFGSAPTTDVSSRVYSLPRAVDVSRSAVITLQRVRPPERKRQRFVSHSHSHCFTSPSNEFTADQSVAAVCLTSSEVDSFILLS